MLCALIGRLAAISRSAALPCLAERVDRFEAAHGTGSFNILEYDSYVLIPMQVYKGVRLTTPQNDPRLLICHMRYRIM